jgi:hypothetical protein
MKNFCFPLVSDSGIQEEGLGGIILLDWLAGVWDGQQCNELLVCVQKIQKTICLNSFLLVAPHNSE